MDDLASTVNSLVMFDDSLNTNSSNYVTHNLATKIHPRLDAYKKNTPFHSSQGERRKNLLVEQKIKRQSLTNLNRSLTENKLPVSKKLSKQTSTALYNNQLMFSEWLEEEPCDLETNWIMVVCPVGKRCLIVATDGVTTAYTKTGRQICKHSSRLPGGNNESKTDYTILDCIFNYELQTYFVLDVLVYKSHPVMDSETEFRFFWLKCKLNEAEMISCSCYGNPYKFQDLPRILPSTRPSIKSVLEQPLHFEVDGLLFYHKEAHYTPGHSPLVLWLKPYMLPEILSISIPLWIQVKTPSDYKGHRDAIDQSDIKQKKTDMYLESIGLEGIRDKKSSPNAKKLNNFTGTNEGYKFVTVVPESESFAIRHFDVNNTGHKESALNSMSEQ